ncbi:MAG TPA: serine/threonine-protein kinase [Gemmatimonadales bacterium]|nr:serine/threonine-protein kinase [Gemmatimonadales bacterium]
MSTDPRPDTRVSRLVETEIGADSARPSNGSHSLPEDVLREAARRLGLLCLISALVWAANFLLLNYVYAVPGALSPERVASYGKWRPLYDAVILVNVFGSLGLWWFTRHNTRRPRFILDLALVYEVLTALSVGMLDYAEQGPTEGVSWIAVVILLFAPIVPSTPGKTLAAAFAAASMGPVGALVWRALGAEPVGLVQILLLSIPNYLCAAMAPVVSHIITRLGREVREAREMGSYLLGEMIGRGGMGEVWQATHRLLVRPAAIKLISPDALGTGRSGQTEMMVQRFRREARAAAALHSPHTIQLYDFGVSRDGTFYYVMELLDGLDLQRLVSRHGPLPVARTIHILRQVCEALGEAHDRGLVHRDIKPANIQVCCRGRDYDYVKVLDFGLVKRLGSVDGGESDLTAPDLLAGTPAYLSPEAAGGEPVDGRSDLYSLGCVAWWMLTGRQVFEADTVIQMIARHLQAAPEPPSRYSAEPIPASLDALVLACLAKRPADRPASAWELADQLAECETGKTWTREDARGWWESRRAPELSVGSV